MTQSSITKTEPIWYQCECCAKFLTLAEPLADGVQAFTVCNCQQGAYRRWAADPDCRHCGGKMASTADDCDCPTAVQEREAKAAEQAKADELYEQKAKDAEAAREAKANAPTEVDPGWALLRRQAKQEQELAARVAARDSAWQDVLDERLVNAQDDLDGKRAARESTTSTGPTDTTLDALTAVFDDEVDLTPVPAVLEREDGALVLPSGKLNWIYGLPGTGKSFLCEIDLIMAVMRGGRALYLDYEDSAKTFHQRAAMLGFNLKDYADCFKYIHGGLSDYPMAQTEAMAWLLEAPNPAMNQVIIDAAESSGCPSDGAPVNDWLTKVVMPWRDPSVNAGVLVADHIPKKSEDRPDGPIGSQRKLAAVDGIALLLSGYCWTKTKGGRITLTNHKDRTGSYARSQTVAVVVGEWEGEGQARSFSYRVVEASKEDTSDNTGGKILNAINDAGPAGFIGKSNLSKAIGGNRNTVFRTIDSLVEGMLLTVSKDKGSDVYKLTDDGQKFVD